VILAEVDFKNCAHCGAQYQAKSANQKYCSRKCQEKANKFRQPDELETTFKFIADKEREKRAKRVRRTKV